MIPEWMRIMNGWEIFLLVLGLVIGILVGMITMVNNEDRK